MTATEVYTETFDTSINIALSKSWSFIYHHTLQFLNNDSGKTFSTIKSFVSLCSTSLSWFKSKSIEYLIWC